MTEPNITPLARRLAEENGIDWRSLEGSGPDGTIVERDILAFLAKVMAGEVELPPQPEDAQPPEEIPDISQVQEALAREGVDLEELVPGITSETTPTEPEPTPVEEEEVLFEMDFEEEFSLEAAEAEIEVEEATEAVEGYFAAEPPPAPAMEEAEVAEMGGEVPEIGEQPPVEAEPAPWESKLEPEEIPEQALEEMEEEFSWEAAVEDAAAAEEVAPAEEAEEAFDESAGWEMIEEPEPEAESQAEELEEPELPVQAEAVSADAAAPLGAAAVTGQAEEEVAAAQEIEEAEKEAAEEAPTEAEVTAAAVFPPAFRRAVGLEALEKARVDLSEAWKKDVSTSLLLFRAVDRALAELEVPMRAVLGRLEGDSVRSLMVYPADNLRALYDHYLNANEPAEGLVVIDLGETPYAEVLLPDAPLVTLGYTGMPAGTGLLSVSGELPTDRTRFLERVAFYLERPILLA